MPARPGEGGDRLRHRGRSHPSGITRAPVMLDDALLAFDQVWAAAGTADTCFPVAPADLVRATGARVVDVRVRG